MSVTNVDYWKNQTIRRHV